MNMSKVATVSPAYMMLASEMHDRMHPTHVFCSRRMRSERQGLATRSVFSSTSAS